MVSPELLTSCPAIQPVAWHLSVGVGIGILGFMGVVVPLVRQGIGPKEKAIWTALFAILLVLELRSIHLDQIQHDREQEFARCQDMQNFQHIADGLSAAIQAGKEQYDSTVRHVDGVLQTTQQIASIAKESLDNITGGDSFAVLESMAGGGVAGGGGWTVFTQGSSSLHSVTLSAVDLDKIIPFWQEHPSGTSLADTQQFYMNLSLNDLAPNTAREVALPISSAGSLRMNVFFMALNKPWIENYSQRLIDGKMRYAIHVSRQAGKKQKTLYTKIDKGFPVDKFGVALDASGKPMW